MIHLASYKLVFQVLSLEVLKMRILPVLHSKLFWKKPKKLDLLPISHMSQFPAGKMDDVAGSLSKEGDYCLLQYNNKLYNASKEPVFALL